MTCPDCGLSHESTDPPVAAACVAALKRELDRVRRLLVYAERALHGAPDY